VRKLSEWNKYENGGTTKGGAFHQEKKKEADSGQVVLGRAKAIRERKT